MCFFFYLLFVVIMNYLESRYEMVRTFASVKFIRMEKFSLAVHVGDLMVLCWHFQILNLILR